MEKEEEELEIEGLIFFTDGKGTLKYDVRVATHVMASATPLVTYSTYILTNNQCSTAFGQIYIW
jgi:hypothetical protein